MSSVDHKSFLSEPSKSFFDIKRLQFYTNALFCMSIINRSTHNSNPCQQRNLRKKINICEWIYICLIIMFDSFRAYRIKCIGCIGYWFYAFLPFSFHRHSTAPCSCISIWRFLHGHTQYYTSPWAADTTYSLLHRAAGCCFWYWGDTCYPLPIGSQ